MTWEQERAKRLRRICEHIERKVRAGAKAIGEVQAASRRWNGKPYKSDPARKFKASAATLRRIYWEFRREGAAAFALDYRAITGSRVPKACLSEFARLIVQNRVRSFSQAAAIIAARAARKGKACLHSGQSFSRALPVAVQAQAKAVFAARCAHAKREAQLRAALAGWPA